jgi:16S rRNA C967 or C1407 C5-methylase (RsmB/RsmF family)
MIPPFFLQVEPQHFVLDMCASPGSKTLQLIESIHRGDKTKDSIPKGIVVANDVNPKRAYMLVNQCKRVGSCSLLVTGTCYV